MKKPVTKVGEPTPINAPKPIKRDRIAEFEMVDTFGIKAVRFPMKSITRIYGDNGLGKSSIINGLVKIFTGGHDPDIIRQGAKKSVITLRLESGTYFVQTTTPKSFTIEGFNELGVPIPSVRTYMKQLAEAISIDPGLLLRLDATRAEQRARLVEEIIKACPVSFEPAEVKAAAGYREATAIKDGVRDATGDKWIERIQEKVALDPDEPLDLKQFKKAVESVRELRRLCGQEKDGTEATVRQLQASLPEPGSDEAAERENYESQLIAKGEELEKLNGQYTKERVEIEAAVSEAVLDAERIKGSAFAAIDADIDAKIAELNRQRESRKEGARVDFETRRKEIQRESARVIGELEATYLPRVQALNNDIGGLHEKIKLQAAASAIRTQLDGFVARMLQAAYKYEQLTKVLERLDQLRLAKFSDLPVKGLNIDDEGMPRVDGVPWPIVNTAKLVTTVMQLLGQMAGLILFQTMDDANLLSERTRKEVEAAMVRDGYQILEAHVTADVPLRIETV